MALIGLCVDCFGFILFHKHARSITSRMPLPFSSLTASTSSSAGSASSPLSLELSGGGSDRGGRESNLAGVFLHVLADVMHHIAHIAAVLLVYWK
jgi:Co/Zn/Cd efflux system component